MSRYTITVNAAQSAILSSALDIFVNLRLGQWGYVLDHAPKMMFDVPAGALPMGDHPIIDVPTAKVNHFRDIMSRMGSNYINAQPGVTFNFKSEGVSDQAKMADALDTRIWGLTRIEISIEEAHLLISALDLYSRLRIGQWGEVVDHGPSVQFSTPGSAGSDPVVRILLGKYATYRDTLNSTGAAFINFVPNGSFGICSDAVEDTARVAYDMQQVIRHRLAWDQHPEGGMTVNFDAPWMTSTKRVPLAIITRIEE